MEKKLKCSELRSYIAQIYYTNQNLNLMLRYLFIIHVTYQLSDVIAKMIIFFFAINKLLVSATLRWS